MILIFSSPVVRRKSERRKRRICCLRICPSPPMLVGCRSVVLSSSAPTNPTTPTTPRTPTELLLTGWPGDGWVETTHKAGIRLINKVCQHSDKASLFIINERYLSSDLSLMEIEKVVGKMLTPFRCLLFWDKIIILLLWLLYPTRDCRRSRHKKEPLPMKLRSLPQSFWQQVNLCLKSC